MTDDSDKIRTRHRYKKDTPMLTQVGTPSAPVQQGMQLRLARTARRGKSRQVSYTKKNGTFGVYQVQRYSFRQHNGVRYFYGWDIRQQTIKSFIRGRISNVAQLDVPHRKMWVVQMGNDPQQMRYWQDQKTKTQTQKAAQKASEQATERARDASESSRARGPDAEAARAAQQAQDASQPVIKTIQRQVGPPPGQTRPTRPRAPSGTIRPFGVV